MRANAHESSREPEMRDASRGGILPAEFRIVAIYAVVAILWILFSDQAMRLLFVDPDVLTRASSVKGAFFVVITSVLLYVLIRNNLARVRESSEQLRQSEQRFRCIVEASPVPMAMNDAHGNITLVNAAFTEVLGYVAEDIPTLQEWWPAAYPDPDYRQQVRDDWVAESERSRRQGDAFVPMEARVRCKDGSERVFLGSAADIDATTGEQVVVLYDLTDREHAEQSLLHSSERLGRLLRSVIGLIGKVVEARDPYTKGHEEGVARIGKLIAEEMGLSESDTECIEVAGLVHDVGKLGVPAEILAKPGKISTIEFQIIQTHPATGHDILRDIEFGCPVADAVLEHHERMDGSGYPRGLRGEEISIPARVLMVADVIEAMGAHRPYRPAHGVDLAMEEITSHPEKFDPDVVEACVRLYQAGRIEV